MTQTWTTCREPSSSSLLFQRATMRDKKIQILTQDINQPQSFPNFVIFKIDNAKVNIDVLFKDETLWLTQKQIAELFEKGRSTITEHLKKIFEERELDEKVVCRNFRHTTQFVITPQNITLHLKNIYQEGELEQVATCKEILQVQKEGSRGVSRKSKYYNLKAIANTVRSEFDCIQGEKHGKN